MKKLITMLLAVAALLACTNEINEPGATRKEIRFTAQIGSFSTKVSGDAFQDGDRIGLYATSLGVADMPLTVKGPSLIPETPIYWDNDSQEDVWFIAFYPYESDFVPNRSNHVQVPTDQTTLKDYEGADILTGSTQANSTQKEVHLVFKHLLSKLVIEVENLTDETIADLTVNNMRIAATHYAALYDGTKIVYDTLISPYIPTGGLKPYRESQGRWSMITIPQTAAPEIVITTAQGNTYQYIARENIVFPQGCSVIAGIVLDGSVTEASFTHEIIGWGDGGRYDLSNIYGQTSVSPSVPDGTGDHIRAAEGDPDRGGLFLENLAEKK